LKHPRVIFKIQKNPPKKKIAQEKNPKLLEVYLLIFQKPKVKKNIEDEKNPKFLAIYKLQKKKKSA
jgi:hypothetical protein